LQPCSALLGYLRKQLNFTKKITELTALKNASNRFYSIIMGMKKLKNWLNLHNISSRNLKCPRPWITTDKPSNSLEKQRLEKRPSQANLHVSILDCQPMRKRRDPSRSISGTEIIKIIPLADWLAMTSFDCKHSPGMKRVK
jgi:hypothetical protein